MEVYWYAGFTVEQAAEILGLTVDPVKYRWELIKRKIARKLEPRHASNRRSAEAV